MEPGRSILVADDRLGIRKLLEEALTCYGCRVKTAGNGAEALKAIHREHFDLVLLDMKMSGLDGLETLTKIKKAAPDLKVVIMTAYEELNILKQAKSRGANGYLVKPFDLQEIFELVNMLGKHEA